MKVAIGVTIDARLLGQIQKALEQRRIRWAEFCAHAFSNEFERLKEEPEFLTSDPGALPT